MIKQESAGVIPFVYENNEILYLLLHYTSGHWDFPKGKLEKNESHIQAAVRELKEETSLQAEIIPGFEESLHYVFKEKGNFVEKTVTFFIGKSNQQTILLSKEHIGYLWLPYQKALAKLTYPNAKEILTKVDHFLLNA